MAYMLPTKSKTGNTNRKGKKMVVVFETPVESVSTGARRGRPEVFSDEFRAALDERVGEWAVLQEGVKGRTRLSTLRRKYAEMPYEFKGSVTEVGTRTNAAGEEVKTETVKIYARRVENAPEVEAVAVDTVDDSDAPALTPAEQAERDAEFEAAAPSK